MTTATQNDLADLGLDLDVTALDTTAAAPEGVKPATAAEAVAENEKPNEDGTEKPKTRQARVHIDVGNIAIEDDVPLTGTTRTSGGSKYKFDELGEPVKKEDGTYSYKSMRIDLGDNDEDALRRSVQSATTQANKAAKDADEKGLDGHHVYFLTRAVTVDGKFTGIRVFRVDGTTGKQG